MVNHSPNKAIQNSTWMRLRTILLTTQRSYSTAAVFKTIGATELKFVVYWSEHSEDAPILLYFHGNGSPVQGSRWDIPKHMSKGINKWRYALISADYQASLKC